MMSDLVEGVLERTGAVSESGWGAELASGWSRGVSTEYGRGYEAIPTGAVRRSGGIGRGRRKMVRVAN